MVEKVYVRRMHSKSPDYPILPQSQWKSSLKRDFVNAVKRVAKGVAWIVGIIFVLCFRGLLEMVIIPYPITCCLIIAVAVLSFFAIKACYWWDNGKR